MRLRILTCTVLAALSIVATAEARTVKKVKKGPHRTTVVVAHHYPITRRPYVVIHGQPRTVTTVRFTPVVFWAPVVVAYPDRKVIICEDSEQLARNEDWTDFALSVNGRGKKLFVEVVGGNAQLNFAEVMFENGTCQVVDFKEKSCTPGVYSLLDFKDGRKVTHVRMVARATSEEARIVVKMRA